MEDARIVQPQRIAAVIDTNVVLEALSCIDLVKLYNGQAQPDPASPVAVLRRQRARESLLLSIHLHNSQMRTFSLFEALRIAMQEVDRDAVDRFEMHATVIWVHYVKETLLDGWSLQTPSTGEGEPKGSEADALLVQKAKEFGVPLVSHEGVGVGGINARCGIRKRAARAGVDVVTPREFYGSMDELLESALFMQRYCDRREEFIAGFPKPLVIRESVEYLHAYYRHILYGITQGHSDALSVRLPWSLNMSPVSDDRASNFRDERKAALRGE